jgi:hypothetical protein
MQRVQINSESEMVVIKTSLFQSLVGTAATTATLPLHLLLLYLLSSLRYPSLWGMVLSHRIGKKNLSARHSLLPSGFRRWQVIGGMPIF